MVTLQMDVIKLILLESIIIEVLALILLYAYLKKKGKRIFQEKKPKIEKKSRFNIKNSLKNLRPTRPEQWFIFIVYLLVFSIIGYFLIGNWFPDQTPMVNSGEYTINAGSLMIFDKLSSFYIDNDRVLGPKENINGFEVRKFVSEEIFNLVFKPATPVTEEVEADLEIDFYSESGVPESNVYLNDEVIVPNLENYELLKDFPNEAVYINKNITYTQAGLVDGTNVQDFIYKNFPGSTVYSFKDDNINYIPELDDYEQEWTSIIGTFRDNLKLAVYHGGGDLEVRFIKQDLNSYVGRDEYTVEIKDSDGKVVFTGKYKDDGTDVKTGKVGEEQDFEIKVKSLKKDIYYITFTKDKNNSGADSTIKNLRITSNKILIVGNSLVYTSFEFYTEAHTSKIIGFKYWWTSKEQTISVSGTETKKIKLDEEWFNIKYEMKIDKLGEYSFRIPLGTIWIYSDYVSPNKENWFTIPSKSQGVLNNEDIVIVDKTKLEIKENNIKFKGKVMVNKDAKVKVKVLDENKIYLESVKLKL